MEDFARAVEDGLRFAKRIQAASPGPVGPSPLRMERSQEPALLPASPMAYAVIIDPRMVDDPDVPSYQPHVYGRLDPPALIPLQMNAVELEAECALGFAVVSVRCHWWLHCVSRSRACDCRVVVPLGEQGSILGAEVSTRKRSYSTQVVDENSVEFSTKKPAKPEGGCYLKPQLFSLTIPQVDGGADIFATIRWSQKLLYDNNRFTVDVPFCFPPYVNPSSKSNVKREQIQLLVNSYLGKEFTLQGTSHSLKEKYRRGGKLSFLYDAIVEKWSNRDFRFTYSVHSADFFGGLLLQSPTMNNQDDSDMFCISLFPGNVNNRKVFRKAAVFVVDISASMRGKPLVDVKEAVAAALRELVEGDLFDIIAFNDEIHSFSACLEQANDEMVEKAIEWMSSNFIAEGGTDIMHSLCETIGLLSDPQGALPHIFLITDGSVDNERSICHTMMTQLTSRGSWSPRISTFGLGSFCNHYFLRMLASIGRGHYDAAFDPDSIKTRIVNWFSRASRIRAANVTIDAFDGLDVYEVYSQRVLDISTGEPLVIFGRYRGKISGTYKAKGRLPDMSEVVIDLKAYTAEDIRLDQILAKQRIDHLTAQAWFSESKDVEKKVAKLSIQGSIPSEYTKMILVQTSPVEGKDAPKQAKPADDRLQLLVGSSGLGFGDTKATAENVPTGFGQAKQPEALVILTKAAGCCNRLVDRCCCCMCCISLCSKLNDQCVTVIVQACTALACLSCLECCSEFCCKGADS